MSYTLLSIKQSFSQFENHLRSISAKTDEEFHQQVSAFREQFLNSITSLRIQYPELLFLNYSSEMPQTAAEEIIESIKERVKGRTSIPIIPSGHFLTDTIQEDKYITPSFIQLQSYTEMEISKDGLMEWMLELLLSMPIGSIRFRFVDLEGLVYPDFFYSNISPWLYYDKPITDEYEFTQILNSLNNRVLKCIQDYGSIDEYNAKKQKVTMPYEIVIVPYFRRYNENHESRLNSLANNGSRGGVYVVRVRFKEEKTLQGENAILHPTPLMSIPSLLKCSLEYIRAGIESPNSSIVSYDLSSVSKHYKDISNGIVIPVGESSQGTVSFQMDTISHVHAFVLGQSGSGKSVFLHDVISGAMLEYSPSDLELYLLDFKLGGVEFNRYKGDKHIRALLVDNSDQQITLEILRELKGRMTERGKAMRTLGVNGINEYNSKSNEKMPHILLIVDECHEMFREGGDIPRTISLEISEIISKIAKEGRNQGIHLLLATQTLSGTEIGSDILNNITDHYLLKCSVADSERLVMNSSEKTASLSTGEIFFTHQNENYIFKAFFHEKESLKDMLHLISDKEEGLESPNSFYFSGAAVFPFTDEIVDNNKTYCKRNPVCFVGKSITLNQEDVRIPLKRDFSENVLVLGQNDEEQTTRVCINIVNSLLSSSRYIENPPHIIVLDYLQNEESKYLSLWEQWAEKQLIEVISPAKRKSAIKSLASSILKEEAKETIIILLGQERFRDLKYDVAFEDASEPEEIDFTSILSTPKASGSVSSVRDAVSVILDKGPELGIHTVMQLDKPSNYLFSDFVSYKDVYQKFKHLVILKSDEMAASQLHLSDVLFLEHLSKDEERMRAYYYCEEKDSYTLFTPYYPQVEQ